MAETIRSTEDRRSPQLFRRLKPFFQRQRWPARLAFLLAASALTIFLAIIFFRYGSSVYNDWHERRLLHRAASMLQQEKFEQAAVTARAIVQLHRESLPAFSILAEATEKQNSEETVWWREQIARLLPTDPDSQLNLASAALRFGQLDVARKALDRISTPDRNRAAFHVVAGWLARAEGNFVKQEEQFAAAVKEEPSNDLYQFNLAALQIHSTDPKKSTFTLFVMADDKKIEKKDRTINEPLQFYTGRDRSLFEVVVNTVDKNQVTGYLVTPKNVATNQMPHQAVQQ